MTVDNKNRRPSRIGKAGRVNRKPSLDLENSQAQARRMTTDGKQFFANREAAIRLNSPPLNSSPDLAFGIVIPTRPRLRFLARALAQVRDQTYLRWHCVLVSDGPSAKARMLFERHTAGDDRFSYLELEAPTNNWGFTPRLRGMDVLASLPQPPDYVAFWDDDNSFYPEALTNIAQALRLEGVADLLLAPIHTQLSQMPQIGLGAHELRCGDVDSANFVVRFELARRLYPNDAQVGMRGQDQRFFARVGAEKCHRIALANIPPIGRYDGLRRLATLRWKLKIPPLGLDGQWWYQPLRRWLRH